MEGHLVTPNCTYAPTVREVWRGRQVTYCSRLGVEDNKTRTTLAACIAPLARNRAVGSDEMCLDGHQGCLSQQAQQEPHRVPGIVTGLIRCARAASELADAKAVEEGLRGKR
jgi:hypothetical protein